MKAAEVPRAMAAAMDTASELGLRVDDGVVLQNSNRLVVRLLPCDVLARVASPGHQRGTTFEVEVARRLAETDAPVAGLEPRVEPRVYHRDGFAVTLWTYHEPVLPRDVAPREYADALERLHAGMRQTNLAAPHFTTRVAEARRLVDNRQDTPDLPGADRKLLSKTLQHVSRMITNSAATEQLLHGEPHAGNLLRTKRGLLFTDLETCCIGPVEFDIAHCSQPGSAGRGAGSFVDGRTPSDVRAHYGQADREVLRACQVLMLAMVAAWRWDRRDQFPDGRRMGQEFIQEIRRTVGRLELDS